MDIEELKRRIDSLDARLTELEGRGNTDEQMAKIKVGRIVTARDRLVRRYRIFTVVGMLMCVVSVILIGIYCRCFRGFCLADSFWWHL